MAWVLNHSQTTATDKLILLGIANHADENGENSWPSVKTLARYAGVTERNARLALRRLEEAGEIKTEVRSGGRVDSDPRYRTNRYTLVRFRGVASDRSSDSGGSLSASRGVASGTSGGSPATGKPSLNRPKPPAGSANAKKIDRALSLAASKGRHRVVELRARHEQDLERFCRQWPAISADQLADFVVNGVLPQTVACLERAE